jgi:hypothetical protein
MVGAQVQDWIGRPVRRDARVDALRGLALLCIYVDHIPRDVLNAVTLRNFGFSDAAELFVLLAGFASMMAYGRSFARDGAGTGLRRIVLRCARLYLFQIALLLATLGIVWAWSRHFDFEPRTLGPMLHGGVQALVPSLTLRAQPSNLNILPLYIVLMAAFPLIYGTIRLSPGFALLVSGAVWLASCTYPDLNFVNSFDGNFWFFAPLAWQFLFTIGAVGALAVAANDGRVPRLRWLAWGCWAFLALGFLETFPWAQHGLPSLAPFAAPTPDKTHLAPLRLLHALALAYVVLTSPVWERWGRSAVARAFALCGRHSLEVFSLGTLLGLVGRLAMRTYGDGWAMQVAVNVLGIGAMLGLAALRERGRARPPAPAAKPAPGLLTRARNLA